MKKELIQRSLCSGLAWKTLHENKAISHSFELPEKRLPQSLGPEQSSQVLRCEGWPQELGSCTLYSRSEASFPGRVFWSKIMERISKTLAISSREELVYGFTVVLANRPIHGVGMDRD